MPKIDIRSGLEANLPKLRLSEPGFTEDTEKLFIGGKNGNIQFAKQTDVVAIQTDLVGVHGTLDNLVNTNASAEVLDARGTYPVLGDRLEYVDTNVTNNTTELSNARGAFPVLKDRLDDVTSQLADNATQLKSQWVNVLYPPSPLVSAKGDGITDDTAAIQACIDYVKNNGIGTLFLPDTSAFYKINGTLTIADDNTYKLRGCKIVGSSKGKTKLQKTTSGYVFHLNGTHEVEISNLWLIGNGSTGTSDGILLTSGAITSQHNVIEKVHFNNIRNAVDLGDGTVANFSQEVDHVKLEALTLTNVFNGIRIRSWNNQLTTINQVRIFLASGSTGSGIELGQPTSGGTSWGTSSIEISNTDCSLIDRVLTGSSAFIRVSGTSNQIKIDSCWCEAIDNALVVVTGAGLSGSVYNTTFNAPIVMNASSQMIFEGSSLRNLVLNSGAFKAQFYNTQMQPSYTISGAATINALMDWWDSGVQRRTFSGTLSNPRQNTGSLGNAPRFLGKFASGASLIAGVNSITFTWSPSLFSPPISPFVLVNLLDPANTADTVHKLWGSIALNTPSGGTHTITINLRLSQAVTLSSDFKFYAEIIDSVF